MVTKEGQTMQTIREVREFLDQLREQVPFPVVARRLCLDMPGISEMDCQRIEQELSIRLPKLYRDILLAYDMRSLELGSISFLGDAQRIIHMNQSPINPLLEFNKKNHLLQIGNSEADVICMRLEEYRDHEGEIVYVSHAKYPRPEQAETEFVCSDFEKLMICATIDLKLRKEAGYSEWSDELIGSEREKALAQQIMNEIIKIEPRAGESSFWYYFIGGF
jgi:hypothetical protein